MTVYQLIYGNQVHKIFTGGPLSALLEISSKRDNDGDIILIPGWYIRPR